MESLEYDKKELFKNWDEYGVDLEGYNRAIREKVNKIELNLEKSKWDLENQIADEAYSNKIERERNPAAKVNQKLQHRIIELEKEKDKLEMQVLTDKKIYELEKSNIKLQTQLTSEKEEFVKINAPRLIGGLEKLELFFDNIGRNADSNSQIKLDSVIVSR